MNQYEAFYSYDDAAAYNGFADYGDDASEGNASLLIAAASSAANSTPTAATSITPSSDTSVLIAMGLIGAFVVWHVVTS